MSAVHQIVEVMSLHVSDTASGVLEDAVDSPNSPRHESVLSVLGLWADAQRCTVLAKDHKQQSGSNRDNNDETMLEASANNKNNGYVSAPVLKATGRPLLLVTGPRDRFL